MLSPEHAQQFSHADLLLIDRTNPMDDSNALALVDHAVGHTDGRDGAALRVKFFLDPDAKAGEPSEIERVKRMTATLLQPMSRWCGARSACCVLRAGSTCCGCGGAVRKTRAQVRGAPGEPPAAAAVR